MLAENNNFVLQLFNNATNNSFIQKQQQRQQFTPFPATIISPLTTSLSAGVNSAQGSLLWSDQLLCHQPQLYATHQNEPANNNSYPLLQGLLGFVVGPPTSTLSSESGENETLLKILQLQLLIQQQQQRQHLAEKQAASVQNLITLLTTMKEPNFDCSAGIFTNSTSQISYTPSDFNKIEKIVSSSSASSTSSLESISRDSTPSQTTIRQSYIPYENSRIATKSQTVSEEDGNWVSGADIKNTRKRSRKESDEATGPSSRPSSSRASSIIVESHDEKCKIPCKKAKTLRKKMQRQDNVTNSPVSGMFIKEKCTPDDLQKAAELDDTASYVHVSDEARQNIARIPDVIGDSICALCKIKYEDVFRLAMHRCPRIVHEEYRCPECDKIFSCPANLASHRRWHRPRNDSQNNVGENCDESKFSSQFCNKHFPTKKSFRSHKKICPTPTTNLNMETPKKYDNNESMPSPIDINHKVEMLADDNAPVLPTNDDQHNIENINAAAALISLGMTRQMCVA